MLGGQHRCEDGWKTGESWDRRMSVVGTAVMVLCSKYWLACVKYWPSTDQGQNLPGQHSPSPGSVFVPCDLEQLLPPTKEVGGTFWRFPCLKGCASQQPHRTNHILEIRVIHKSRENCIEISLISHLNINALLVFFPFNQHITFLTKIFKKQISAIDFCIKIGILSLKYS